MTEAQTDKQTAMCKIIRAQNYLIRTTTEGRAHDHYDAIVLLNRAFDDVWSERTDA